MTAPEALDIAALGVEPLQRRRGGYLPLSDYGAIGDCRSMALVGADGSIDWCCLPRFDSPSFFARILDRERGGFWQIAPVDPYGSRQAYSDKTNVLRTIFRTGDGLGIVTDLMPVDEHDVMQHARPHRHPRIVRLVTGLAGAVTFEQTIDARPDYGRSETPLRVEGGRAHGDNPVDGHHYCIGGTIPITGLRQRFTVHAGNTVAFSLTVNRMGKCPSTQEDVETHRNFLRQTQNYWWRWIRACTYDGPYQEHVWRSALALKLVTYGPTGAIVAAPTTSLPEWIGGPRNWDYRFTWLRDASFTLYSLFQLGFADEARDFMHWLTHLSFDKGLKILYDLDGRGAAPEVEIEDLEGYWHSRPVRIGNGAVDQRQIDIYGELLDSALIYVLHGGEVTKQLWHDLTEAVEFAIEAWSLPDASLWEVRGENLQFTYGKAMCWAAVDRGLRIAKQLDLPHDRARWEREKQRIHRAVMTHGYSKRLESFTQAFGSDELDASALRLVQLGFLRPTDRRLRSTIDAIDAALSEGPLVYRYRTDLTDDGLDSPEGSFIICAFWLADALALVGELEQAQRRFERLLQFASPLGLFSEEVHPRNGELLGNYPQAFSHLALISAAVNIERQRNRELRRGVTQAQKRARKREPAARPARRRKGRVR